MRKAVNVICYLVVAIHVAVAIYCAIQGATHIAVIFAYFGFSLWIITGQWNDILELRSRNDSLERCNMLLMEELTKDGDFVCDKFRIEKRLIDSEGPDGEDQKQE